MLVSDETVARPLTWPLLASLNRCRSILGRRPLSALSVRRRRAG
jgi:hypothetical protein